MVGRGGRLVVVVVVVVVAVEEAVAVVVLVVAVVGGIVSTVNFVGGSTKLFFEQGRSRNSDKPDEVSQAVVTTACFIETRALELLRPTY